MPLAVAEVRIPGPGIWVQMDRLGLFLAVRAALPGEHRPFVAGLAGGGTGLIQSPETIQEQRAGDLRQPEVEERVDIEVVPEDVSPVRLAVQTAGGGARVEVGRVWGANLEDVQDVKADQKLDPVIVRYLHVARVPQFVPGTRVPPESLLERAAATGRRSGVSQRFVYGTVARGVEGDHLLDPDGRFLLDLEVQDLMDVVLHLKQATVHVQLAVLTIDLRAGRLGHVDPGLAGTDLQGDNLRAERPGGDGIQVPALRVARNGRRPRW